MRAFIVRPFGKRKTGGEKPVEVDFDLVESALIGPALQHHGISGRTTLDLAYQNNIRIDMFERLVTADLVIADISIHNANVFYELGIRHALRDKHTFMIRCRGDDVPFDLRTDRYLEYDRENPAATLPQLIAALGQTIDAEHKDSPVFQLLPELEPEDPAKFLVVPRGFTEEVERAAEPGDLELLAEEARGFAWETPALRLVGRAQFKAKAWEGARATWEAVRDLHPDDLEAHLKLATIYQRLKDPARSDQACKRVLEHESASTNHLAEAYSLRGSNEKVSWGEDFRVAAPDRRREEALRSSRLRHAYEQYDKGFEQDCSHYYSGLNALALLAISLELADALPEVWAERFDTDAAAQAELATRKAERDKLAVALEWSLRTATCQARLRRPEEIIWIEISKADLRLLTSKRPRAVAAAYNDALTKAKPMEVDSVRRQLAIYREVGVLDANVAAALAEVDARHPPPAIEQPPRVLLFTGHRVDTPGRSPKRFPPDMEAVARGEIERVVKEELALAGGKALGIAGGASGGDILFHEVCQALDIPTRLYLAIPPTEYQVASVQEAGADWVERFRALWQRVPPRVLQDGEKLPAWLREKEDYTVWQRNNLWMLHNALALGGGANVSLIALWDGEARGDGPGGSADMVRKAEERGAKKRHIDTKKLFGL